MTDRSWWWEKDEDDPSLASSIFETVKHLEQAHAVRRAGHLHHLRLYSNRAALSVSGRDFAQAVDAGEKIRMNVVKSCIDSATAQIGTNRTRPMFKTIKGDYARRKKAEGLGRFVMGQFHALQQYILGIDILKDGMIFGTGIEQVSGEDGRIEIERVLPWDMYVDDNDGRMRLPHQFFRHHELARELLLEEPYNLSEDEANRAIYIRPETSVAFGIVNPASVIEAYHTPSTPDSKDGRHIVCVNSKVITDEAWNRPEPFAVFRWNTAPIGWWGVGLSEELSSIQVEINYIAQKIQRLMTLVAGGMIFTQKGSGLRKITNQDWARYEYAGKEPIVQVISAVSAEYFNHLDRLYNRAFEIAGISQLHAQGLKPAGLDSGEALRVFHDINTARFKHTEQLVEQFYLDVSKLMIYAAKDAGDISVLACGDRDVEEVNFKEVDLDHDKYVMQAWPTALLPDSPAGKIAALQSLSQIAPELQPYVINLMTGIPDLEAAVSRANAPRELAQKMVAAIVEHGIAERPIPEMDLAFARKEATLALVEAQIDGVPQEHVDMLREFNQEIDAMMAPPPSPPVAGAVPGLPATGVPAIPPGTPLAGPGPMPGGPMPQPMPGAPQMPPVLPQ